jgi:hypothetical protein
MTVTGCSGKEKEPVDKLPKDAGDILNKAQEFELYSLEPYAEGMNKFHGCKVLGKIVVKKGETYTKLLAALNESVGDNGAKCFDPRHAIRAVHDGKSVDLVICFQCRLVYVYRDSEEKEIQVQLRDSSAEPVLDQVLKDAGVPLAPKEFKKK